MLKRIKLNQVTLCADGSIGVQWLKQVLDGDVIVLNEPHRTVVEFDGDVDSQIGAASAHIEQMGYPAVTAEEISRVKAVHAIGLNDPAIAVVRQAKIEAKAGGA